MALVFPDGRIGHVSYRGGCFLSFEPQGERVYVRRRSSTSLTFLSKTAQNKGELEFRLPTDGRKLGQRLSTEGLPVHRYLDNWTRLGFLLLTAFYFLFSEMASGEG